MDFKALKNDFKIRYNKKKVPYCAFCGAPVFILGGLGHGMSSLSAVLSSGTGIAVAANERENNFNISQSCENVIFSAAAHCLGNYSEDNYAAPLFELISTLQKTLGIDIFGADILLHHSTNNIFFHNSRGALLCALALMLDKTDLVWKTAMSENSAAPFGEALTAALFLGQEQCLLCNAADGKRHIFKLPLAGKKIIIITCGTRSKPLPPMFSDARNKIRELCPRFNCTAQPFDEALLRSAGLSEREERIIRFAAKEEARILRYPTITEESSFFGAINESGRELCEIAEEPALSILFEILSDCDGVLSRRPLSDNSGILCIARNDAVDDILEKCESEYEKKAGKAPAFYICDTAFGGFSRGLIH